jgi:hypothetical protein
MCLFSDPIGSVATIKMGQCLKWASVRSLHEYDGTLSRGEKGECAMPYCITLRSRTDARLTGWYDGSGGRWSTDHNRRKVFDKKSDAGPVCHELRSLCPRNAEVINIEAKLDDPSVDMVPPM